MWQNINKLIRHRPRFLVDISNLSQKDALQPMLRPLWLIGSISYYRPLASSSTIIRIATNGTVDAKVNIANEITEIIGGTQVGENLFHSFQEFSVSRGNTAYRNQTGNLVLTARAVDSISYNPNSRSNSLNCYAP